MHLQPSLVDVVDQGKIASMPKSPTALRPRRAKNARDRRALSFRRQ